MKFKFKAKVWKYNGVGPWFFVYLPDDVTLKVKKLAKNKVGFGFIPIEAKIEKVIWKTTLFPTKEGPYLLSIKAPIRKKLQIFEDDEVSVSFNLI